MRVAFAAIVGLTTGVLVAGAPTANGAVLLLGVLIGVVLYAAFQPPADRRVEPTHGALGPQEDADAFGESVTRLAHLMNERETDPVPASDGPVSRMEREEATR